MFIHNYDDLVYASNVTQKINSSLTHCITLQEQERTPEQMRPIEITLIYTVDLICRFLCSGLFVGDHRKQRFSPYKLYNSLDNTDDHLATRFSEKLKEIRWH